MARVVRGSAEFLQEQQRRRDKLDAFRKVYPTPLEFVEFVFFKLWGWTLTDKQREMVRWFTEEVDANAMMQMPRGEGKTTILSILAVYDLLIDPTARVVVFSGGQDLADEIAGFVNKIIFGLEELEFLRPAPELNDKQSEAKFSVSGYLRGVDKSPSIQARTILGGFAGIRADKIICDDLERERVGSSAVRREELAECIKNLPPLFDGSKEGQVIRMAGTPQGEDSVYNDLPAYGYAVRVWPARVPSKKDYDYYGDLLAPSVRERYLNNPADRVGHGLDGTRGAIVDPERFSEAMLIEKEMGMGAAKFDLQYMLNTKASDQERHPLKLEKLLFMELDRDVAPITINTLRSEATQIKLPPGFSVPMAKLNEIGECVSETQRYNSCTIYIDPAGGGKTSKDETAIAVVLELNGYIFVDRIEGYSGGFSEDVLDKICTIVESYWVRAIPLAVYVEDNFGNGMFRTLLEGKMIERNIHVTMEGDRATGQKERRIIDNMLPLISSNRLIFNKNIIQTDVQSTRDYSAHERNSYSLFHQIKFITHDRGALRHDDRLDALSGAVQFYADALVTDQTAHRKELEKQKRIQEIRRSAGPNADTILRNLGYIPGRNSGASHKNFGAFKNKKEHKYVEQKFKSPAEKIRWETNERLKAESSRSKGGRGAGAKASGYFGKNRK